jgi:crotonobetainyl-CoA:carnitine CoA-transferase CaiB-like acyl-CoA transferase
MADVVTDPHVIDRGIVLDVDGVGMQNVIARLSRTPGAVRFAARPLGADRDEVLAELERLEAAED